MKKIGSDKLLHMNNQSHNLEINENSELVKKTLKWKIQKERYFYVVITLFYIGRMWKSVCNSTFYLYNATKCLFAYRCSKTVYGYKHLYADSRAWQRVLARMNVYRAVWKCQQPLGDLLDFLDVRPPFRFRNCAKWTLGEHTKQ